MMSNNLISKPAAITDVNSRDVVPTTLDTDHRAYGRLGWIIVLFGVLGFTLWAAFAPLDKGVPISGSVVVATQRKAVQHLQGGTIQDILVKEGDSVKEGQVLVRMNNVQTKAQAESSRVQYFAARAAEARLTAERDGKKQLSFPPELEKEKNDPRIEVNMSMQKQLFHSRQLALQNELAAMEQSITGLKNQISALEQSRDSKKAQAKIIKEQVASLRELTADGFVARNRLLDLERNLEQINGAIAEDSGNIGRSQSQIAEVNLRRTQRQQEYQKEVRSQLAELQSNVEALENRLVGQDFELANAEVKSPATGTVVGIAVFTKGGVIGPGFKMMDIIPKDDALIIEGRVPVHLIDKVHPKLEVELGFSAFNQNTTPHIPGIVKQVSADRLTDERTGEPYYKVIAEVTPEGLKKLRDLKVLAGMPVDIFVKTGERTLASYLLKPIFDRARTSLAEE